MDTETRLRKQSGASGQGGRPRSARLSRGNRAQPPVLLCPRWRPRCPQPVHPYASDPQFHSLAHPDVSAAAHRSELSSRWLHPKTRTPTFQLFKSKILETPCLLSLSHTSLQSISISRIQAPLSTHPATTLGCRPPSSLTLIPALPPTPTDLPVSAPPPL